MSVANQLEQQMLTPFSRERAKVGVAHLIFNDKPNISSKTHSQWMQGDDVLPYTGHDGSTPTAHIQDAGYKRQVNWHSGDNIAFQSVRGAPGLADDVNDLQQSLMNSPRHAAHPQPDRCCATTGPGSHAESSGCLVGSRCVGLKGIGLQIVFV